MKPRPSEHWVCFDCRKQLRRLSRWDGERRVFPLETRLAGGHSCPECKAPMVDMGRYFRPPRRADKRAWEQMRLLAEHGVRFRSEGAVAYQRAVVGPRPGLRQTKDVIASCPCHTRTEGQRLLQKIAQHHERHGQAR